MPASPPVVDHAPLASTPPPPPPAPRVTKPKRRRLPWAVAAVSLLLAAFASGWAIAENRAHGDAVDIEVSSPIPTSIDPPPPDTTTDESLQPVDPEADPTAPPVDDLEPAAAAAARVAPAVVLIEVENFGQGSGIIYDADGHIVTNAHVIGNADNVTVRLASGRRVDAEVLGRDTAVDVAVVKIDPAEDFTVADFASDDTVEVGQAAIAIGSPFGLEQTVTAGIVSALDRVVLNELEGQESVVGMIQTDAPINPGNSGGALVDREGRVIGMNTSIRTDGTAGNIGVGFAIPSDTVTLIAGRIINGESLDLGFIGINMDEPVIGDPGALVAGVSPDTPADRAGVEVGDLIVGFDGEEVRSREELAAKVRLTAPGTTVDMEVVRDGINRTLTITVGAAGG